MTMLNHLMYSARRSDCLLALLPCNNGCVINPLRQGFMYPAFNSSASGSWAQRHGLITPSNITITASHFESSDLTKKSHIATPLDFQNNSSSKTFIVKARCQRCNDGTLHINPFITQGLHSGSANQQVFQFALWENASDTRLRGYVSTNEGVFAGTNVVLDASVHTGWHVFAMIVDYDYTPSRVYIRLYWNGLQIGSSSRIPFPWYAMSDSSFIPDTVSIRLDTDTKYITNTQIAWAMIFDCALAPEEIQLFK